MELQTFQHEQFGDLRIYDENGEVWFIGKDVATALGYNNQSKAITEHIDAEDRKKANFQFSQNGRVGNSNLKSATWLINESGLYSLILSSKLPAAKAFKRWVTSEVLPSIRKTGKYELLPDAPADVVDNSETLDINTLEYDQRIRIASIIANCKRERLPLIAQVLSLEIVESQALAINGTASEKTAYDYICSIFDNMKRDTPIRQFYNDYTHWCMMNDVKPLTKTGLGKVLKAYFPVQAVSTSWYENGVRIASCVRCYRKIGGAAK